MISKELEAKILQLHYAEKWRTGTISNQLGVHHSTVRRVIMQEGHRTSQPPRVRKVDPYLPFIIEILEKYPSITASRLYDMVSERGYPGKPSQFRAIISEIRPRKQSEAYHRLKTLPGEQAQVDWGHFGRISCGNTSRPLMGFVIVLSYSRAIFLRFFLSQNLGSFLHGHEMAFRWFGGVSRVCLYDNLKSVVLERTGQAIRFNPHFLDYASHCRFEARPVAIARGNEKGRTERAIRYIRSNFFSARRYKNLDDLNLQALEWCENNSLERAWPEDTRRKVRDVFNEEREKLLSLPAVPYPCEERCEVSIGKTPYARFDLNDYSVPHTMVKKTLVVRASIDTVRILDADKVVAEHQRSYERHKQIEKREHIERLTLEKREASEHRKTNTLSNAVPSSKELLEQAVQKGLPLRSVSRELLELMHTYGSEALEAATKEALSNNAAHPHAVRHILERIQKQAGESPSLPLNLPDDPRVKGLTVKTHKLSNYDTLLENSDGKDKSSK